MDPEDGFDKEEKRWLPILGLIVIVTGTCGVLYQQVTKEKVSDHDAAFKPMEEFSSTAPTTNGTEEVSPDTNPFTSQVLAPKSVAGMLDKYQAPVHEKPTIAAIAPVEPVEMTVETPLMPITAPEAEDPPLSRLAVPTSDTKRREANTRISTAPIVRRGQKKATTMESELASLEGSRMIDAQAAQVAIGTADFSPKRDIQTLLDGYPVSVAAVATGNRQYMIGRGTLLPCVLETTIHTDLPGITRCILPKPVYSDNGQRLLLPRGTFATGEYQGGMQRGVSRVFVVWTRLRTPEGAIIDLAAPGVGPLGASGLTAELNPHFWGRFGASMLLSIIGGLSATENNSEGSFYGATANTSGRNAEIALENSINIETTGRVDMGTMINMIVAEDINFEGIAL